MGFLVIGFNFADGKTVKQPPAEIKEKTPDVRFLKGDG